MFTGQMPTINPALPATMIFLPVLVISLWDRKQQICPSDGENEKAVKRHFDRPLDDLLLLY
jgi:hypothetical protein